jgi:hypothetical protein
MDVHMHCAAGPAPGRRPGAVLPRPGDQRLLRLCGPPQLPLCALQPLRLAAWRWRGPTPAACRTCPRAPFACCRSAQLFAALALLARCREGGYPPLASAPGLLACLNLAHYVTLSFVYPLGIASAKPTPVGNCLMALAFCLWNSAMHGAFLAAVHVPVAPQLLRLHPRACSAACCSSWRALFAQCARASPAFCALFCSGAARCSAARAVLAAALCPRRRSDARARGGGWLVPGGGARPFYRNTHARGPWRECCGRVAVPSGPAHTRQRAHQRGRDVQGERGAGLCL